MSEAAPTTEPTLAELAGLIASQAQQIEALQEENEAQRIRLAWFQRQLFGPKSERYIPTADSTQMHLGESLYPEQDAAQLPLTKHWRV